MKILRLCFHIKYEITSRLKSSYEVEGNSSLSFCFLYDSLYVSTTFSRLSHGRRENRERKSRHGEKIGKFTLREREKVRVASLLAGKAVYCYFLFCVCSLTWLFNLISRFTGDGHGRSVIVFCVWLDRKSEQSDCNKSQKVNLWLICQDFSSN